MNTPPNQAKIIFLDAIEIDLAVERDAYVVAECGTDEALRGEVEGLLEHYKATGSFLQSPERRSLLVNSRALSERPGAVIGPYKLLQQIGEGGMGTVFMAEQTWPVHRQVALKLIKPGLDNHLVIARFEAERQALALMDHPNIARVLDAGSIEGRPGERQTGSSADTEVIEERVSLSPGRPYFVMELVKGVPITRYCDDNHLTLDERLELFLPVCQAVQHAHQKGIIHRDIKPSNVLVCHYDDKPVPKVIDFGVAKATGPKLTERTLFTEFGSVVGTLEYMSPEQAMLNQLDIDTRSDIYSLGVLLYELLTGTTPLDRKRFEDTAFLEVLRLIREAEPPRPSTRLSTSDGLPAIAADRGLEPSKLSAVMRGELDWIVMKALEKDRNRRYETPNGLALDIQRYLHDETVQACPPSAGYRLHKFVRRNRGPVLAASLLLFVLLAGMLGTSIGLLHARASAAAERLAKLEALEKQKLAEKLALAEETRFRLARRLADDMIQIADEDSDGGPGQQQSRRRLLEAAVAYYQEFIELRRENPDTQAELEVIKNHLKSILADVALIRDAQRHQLLTDRAVQEDLKLSGDQRVRIQAVFKKNPGREPPRHRPGGDEMSSQQLSEMRDHETAITAILAPEQLLRLGQIALQVRGAQALREPQVVATLFLTPEQQEAMRGIVRGPPPRFPNGPGPRSSSGQGPQGGKSGPPPRRKPGGDRESELPRALAVLTPAQLTRWLELTGPPFAGLTESNNGPTRSFATPKM